MVNEKFFNLHMFLNCSIFSTQFLVPNCMKKIKFNSFRQINLEMSLTFPLGSYTTQYFKFTEFCDESSSLLKCEVFF